MTGRGNHYLTPPPIDRKSGQTPQNRRPRSIATHCHPLPLKKTKQGQGVVIFYPYKQRQLPTIATHCQRLPPQKTLIYQHLTKTGSFSNSFKPIWEKGIFDFTYF
jgi:hypothetical protein